MKTWEMIKELTENPEKEFIRKTDGLHIKTNKDGELIWANGYQFMRLDHEWEEVKEPVDFMELMRHDAYFTIEHELLSHVSGQVYSLTSLMYDFCQTFSEKEVREIILNGKFYIEQ